MSQILRWDPFRRVVNTHFPPGLTHGYFLAQNYPGEGPFPPGGGSAGGIGVPAGSWDGVAHWGPYPYTVVGLLYNGTGVFPVDPFSVSGSQVPGGTLLHNGSVWDISVWYGEYFHPDLHLPWTFVYNIAAESDGFAPFDPMLPP